jgi:RNA exonuclease 1
MGKNLCLTIQHKAHITHTVLLLIPGLLPAHLGLELPTETHQPFPTSPIHPNTSDAKVSRVPYLTKMFAYGVPVRAPGDNRRMFSVMSTLLNAPLSEAARSKKDEEAKRIAGEFPGSVGSEIVDEVEMAKSDDSPPFLYLLTPNQMKENDYRLPGYLSAGERIVVPGTKLADLSGLAKLGGVENGNARDDLLETSKGKAKAKEAVIPTGWAETPEATGPPADGKYPILAIDCEMVCSLL